MLLLGIGTKFFGSFVKSIKNDKGTISIVLESGNILTQEEVESILGL